MNKPLMTGVRLGGGWPLAILAGWLALFPARGQISMSGVIRNFKTAVDAEQPGRRTVLTSQRADPAGPGRYKITGLRLESYRDQAVDLVVEAPECFYDLAARNVQSSGALTLRATDGRFSINGAGFLFELGQTHLKISNQVETVIRKAAVPLARPSLSKPSVKSSTNAASSAIHIHSEQFDYLPDVAAFEKNVKAVEPAQGELECGRLVARFGPGGRLERLEAEERVRLTQPNGQAESDRAIYDVPYDLITLTGHAAWKFENRQGQAGMLTVHRGSRAFSAKEGVVMTLPLSSIWPRNLLSKPAQATEPAPSSTNQFVKISADEFRYEGAEGFFSGHVHGQSSGTDLQCERLTLKSSKPEGPPEEVIAEEGVVIAQGKNRARAAKAVYLAANKSLTLTGQPSWSIDQAEGTGTMLTFADNKITAAGPVRMTVPSNARVSLGIQIGPNPTHSAPAENRPVVITADQMEHQEGLTRFSGHVHATDRAAELSCGTLRVIALLNKVAELVAEGQVRMVDGDRRANAQTAVYWVDDGTVRLTGAPEYTSPDLTIQGAEFLFVDQARHTFSARGPYQLDLSAASKERLARGSAEPSSAK